MTRILKTVLLVIALLLPGVAMATAQVPDVIRINGEEHALNTNPLRPWLAGINWKPPAETVTSTANWRGYVASWEVRDDQLVLTDVTIRLHGAERGEYIKKSILADLFPSKSGGVVADWYSGALIIPQGEIIRYVHMGYGSSYERYRILRIDAGRVIEHLVLSHDEFERYKDEKFKAFTATDEFRKSFEELRRNADGMTEEQTIGFMKSFYSERYLSL